MLRMRKDNTNVKLKKKNMGKDNIPKDSWNRTTMLQQSVRVNAILHDNYTNVHVWACDLFTNAYVLVNVYEYVQRISIYLLSYICNIHSLH